MTEYTSEVKTIPCNDGSVFALLSDLSNLERFRERMPEETFKNISFDRDGCSFDIHPAGRVEFRIVDREPNSTIKLQTVHFPMPLSLWIQLKPESQTLTRMKITLRADLNPLLKPMVSKPIQEALDRISTLIATLPYE
ncbi:MAG: SRPBCC family protein [Tannerella sp.]|nr:SRPBCC family protein [Tannerella sp.]